MPLVLSLPNRATMFAEIVARKAGSAVFVPVSLGLENYRAGERHQVVLQLADERLGTTVDGVLAAVQQGDDGQPPGVLVVFPEDQREKCRSFLGVGPVADLPVRREMRVDCQLPVRLVDPASDVVWLTRNLSTSGVLLVCGAPLAAGQKVSLTLELNATETLTTRTVVAWVRTELKLVGLKFSNLDAGDADRLDRALRALEKASQVGGAAPAPQPPQAAPVEPAAVPVPQAAPLEGTEGVPARPDIILADDEPATLLFVSRALAKGGISVATFGRGDDALKAIRAQRPRLVLLDVLMPGIDGLQVCSLIRADAMLSATPVVLLSGLEREKVRKIAEESGATAWLQKPLVLTELRALVDKLLGRSA